MDKVTIVLITLVVYKLFLIGVGFWAQRRTHTTEDFFLGGRGLGPVVAAISYSASSSSAWTLLGVSGAAFVMGISAIWLVVGAVLGMIFSWAYIGSRMLDYSHSNGLITLTDFLAHGSEGGWRRAIIYLSSIIIIFAFSFYVAAQFQGAGNTFHQTFDLSMTTSIVLGGVIIMIYTFLGGFWAVSITDTVQGLLMMGASILLPVAAFIEVGGVDGFMTGLKSVSTASQLSLTGVHTGIAAIGFVLGASGVALGAMGQPHLLVRFMALRDQTSLSQARVIAVTWFFIVFGGMCFVGLVGHILIPDVANPEYIFFALTDYLFSPVVAAILVAAVLSAIMSTADSQLLVGASAVSHDMGLGKMFPGKGLLISRITIAVLVALAIIVSLTLPSTIFKRALLAWTCLGAGFGPLVLLRLSGVKIRQHGAFLGILAGFLFALFFHFNPGNFVQDYLMLSVPATLFERIFSFIAGLLVLMTFREKSHE